MKVPALYELDVAGGKIADGRVYFFDTEACRARWLQRAATIHRLHPATTDDPFQVYVPGMDGEWISDTVCDECFKRLDGKIPIKCDQCEACMINGVFCHETGCPNSKSRYDAEEGRWIKQRKCFDCGCTVDVDDPCCSAEPEPEPEPEDEEEHPDDLCDLCYSSQRTVNRTTYCGKTIGVECGCDEDHPEGCCNDEACEDCKPHRAPRAAMKRDGQSVGGGTFERGE